MIGELILASTLLTQTQTPPPPVTPVSYFEWDEQAASSAEAQALVYKYVLDGGAKVPFTGVICTGTASPYQCSVPVPAITPGVHTIFITATDPVFSTLESGPSNTLSFTFKLVPGVPQNFRIK